MQIIFDLNDQQMVFEISDTKEGHAACLHAAAVVLTPQGKEGASDGGEGIISASVSFTRFNISNDKYYTNKKTHQQQKSHAKKRAIHGIKVMHSLPAAKLQSMKPKLSKWVFFLLTSPHSLIYGCLRQESSLSLSSPELFSQLAKHT